MPPLAPESGLRREDKRRDQGLRGHGFKFARIIFPLSTLDSLHLLEYGMPNSKPSELCGCRIAASYESPRLYMVSRNSSIGTWCEQRQTHQERVTWVRLLQEASLKAELCLQEYWWPSLSADLHGHSKTVGWSRLLVHSRSWLLHVIGKGFGQWRLTQD